MPIQDWNTEEWIEQFTLLPIEINFLGSNAPHNHLGKALMLKFFQSHYRFPESLAEIPQFIVEHMAQQLDLPAKAIDAYDWQGRSIKSHRREIREQIGFRPATLQDQAHLRSWLEQEVLPQEHRVTHLEPLVYQWLRQQFIEPPTKGRINRLIISAIERYEGAFFKQTYKNLSPGQKANLQRLIYPESHEEEDGEPVPHYLLHELKVGAGAPTVKNIKQVANRLKVLQAMELPTTLFEGTSWGFLQQ